MAAVNRALRVAYAVPLALVLLAGCSESEVPQQPAPPPAAPVPSTTSASAAPSATGDPAARAQALVTTLTDAQLAGQVTALERGWR